MNAIEIEEAISELALQPFDAAEFPYAFLEAFGNKTTTIKRLKKGTSNKSDIGGVLQANHIHIAVAEEGEATSIFSMLKSSPATKKAKAKFILATDGINFEAEDLLSGETVACEYEDFPNHFGFFLPLAGITTVKQLRDSSFDIRATSRLNKLYIQLLNDNPDWGESDQRHEMNHFMARLIFCFFAEDTDIFAGSDLFTDTIDQMSARDSSNTHEVISEIFRAMNTDFSDRSDAKLPRWVELFPYVNGGLFSDGINVPRFSKIARSYLLHIGNLDWTQINPDIFGSMIQAVADDDERGSLGMHYTSVPNILKVLNPLFLDDLREKLGQADTPRKLINLRNRIARIRVFDPACGSGNFLIIAYKQMREIENTINERRGEIGRTSDIPLTNFRGIELRDFSAEIARLALIIAEYQCDVIYRGQKEALQAFLPLDAQNWITCDNALCVDWLNVCPPTGTEIKRHAEDLFEPELEQPQIDFENEGGETYICGNPPFSGSRKQTKEQKNDLENVFKLETKKWKNIDYVGAWFWKAIQYNKYTCAPFCFVATNSICQGQQVSIIWKMISDTGFKIRTAHLSFKWQNLASNNAGVTVIVVSVDNCNDGARYIISGDTKRKVENISPYLIDSSVQIIEAVKKPISHDTIMDYGVYYSKSKGLMLDSESRKKLLNKGFKKTLIRPFIGTSEFIDGKERYCLWLEDSDLDYVNNFEEVKERIQLVKDERLATKDVAVNKLAKRPHQFRERKGDKKRKLFIPIHTSENREYLPIGFFSEQPIIPNSAFALFDPPMWALALLSSKLHLIWVSTVCGKLETRYRYSNTMGWNTFPVPQLTDKNKVDLTRSAEDILLAREAHFPATIADLYNPETMPDNLRQAHQRNDEVLERIYIGRRFKNDTERLEKLFELYTKMMTKLEKGVSV